MKRASFFQFLSLTMLFGMGTFLYTPSPSLAEEKVPPTTKKIEDLDKKIRDLDKKLHQIQENEGDGTIPESWVKSLQWRSIGPASMGGRIIAISVYPKDHNVWWVATASGGLLKTTNNGNTFVHQFDKENTVSIGDVAVAPSNQNIVWVGTGENNPRNSVSYGDGVYKSVDGGKTWKHMGLKETFQIGQIAIHPKNPNIVYVGALGRLYGPSKERGVYKTVDGGKTWKQVWYVDDKTGVIDLQINPKNPNEILMAAWERLRDEFDSFPGSVKKKDGYDGYDPIVKWGPNAGIYKSSDAGKTWKKLTKGLPSGKYGRVGLDFYRKNPNIVYAIVDCENIGKGTPPPSVYLGVSGISVKNQVKLTTITNNGPASKAGVKKDDIVQKVNGKPIKLYVELVRSIQKSKPGDKLKLSVLRGKESKEITVTLEKRPDQNRRRQGVYLGLNGSDDKDGFRVTQVVANGPAAKGGFKVGDVIKTADKKKVENVQQLFQLSRGKKVGDKVVFEIDRKGKAMKLTVALGARPSRNPGRNQSTTRPYGAWYGGQRENSQDLQGPNSHEYGGIYRSEDGGESWTRVNSLNPRPMYFSQVRVDPSNDKNVYVLGVSMYRSKDAGKTFTADGANQVHPDQHDLWIDPKDSRHMIVGTDGGFYVTHDRMDHWDHYAHYGIAQFYHVAVDQQYPYNVYGGLQDNGSWGGPSRSLTGRGLTNHDWFMLGGGDGFICRVDRDDNDIVYFESQDGNVQRRNIRTNERASLKPRAPRGKEYRFNWMTPFILSYHNPRIVYLAGNYVFRSLNRGGNPQVISPEITRTKRGSATALAESPRNANILYVGTDDGNLWVTKDGGKNWSNITSNVGLPGPRWVNYIEPSRSKEGRVYVVFDGHRNNDDSPHVYVSEDYGQTWKSINANLPERGTTRVLREDPSNTNLLYLGTEFSLFASINRGKSWTKINNNLPTVAIHEIAIHDKMQEIVAATHGRSLWVLDVSALRQMKPSLVDEKVHLFKPNRAVQWRSEPIRGTIYGMGHRHFLGQDPSRGAHVYVALKKNVKSAKLKIVDIAGKTQREIDVPKKAGLHRVTWNMTRLAFRIPRPGQPQRGFSAPAPAGVYRVVLTVDGQEFAETLQVMPDPTNPSPLIAEEENEEEESDGRWDD